MKKQVSAKIIADSIGEHGSRLTTFLVTYHRFVHAEHLRHRMQSFNVSSSRAIPGTMFQTLVKETELEPVWWGKNQAGMQAREELTGSSLDGAKQLWREARGSMLNFHAQLLALGLHKQIANRLLEPWLPVTVLVSATDWANFFKLRCHPDAQPEIQALADAMLFCYCNSVPKYLAEGVWHIPFGDRMEKGWTLRTQLKVATARCARLSYLTFEGDIDLAKDCALHDRLAESNHWSPFEHIAKCMPLKRYYANFRGWRQYRKQFNPEHWSDDEVDLKKLLKERQDAGSVYAQE